MGPNDYIVPFGLDGTPFFKELNDMTTGATTLGNKVEGSVKQMQDAFNQAASSGDKLNDKLKTVGAGADQLRTIATRAGQEINAALSGKGIDSKFEGKINQIKKALEKVASTTVYLDVNFDDKKVAVLEAEIKKAATAQEEFNAVIEFGKQQLSQMEAGGESYRQLANNISKAEELITKLGESQNKVIPDTERLANEFENLLGDPGRFLGVKQLEDLDKQIDKSGTEVSRLDVTLQALGAQLNNLDPDSAAFAELSNVMDAGREAMKAYGAELVLVESQEESATEKTVTLRTELQGIKNEMAALLSAGQGGSQAFADLSERAAELQSNINNTNQEVRNLSSNTQLLDAGIGALEGLAGGFAAAQGAAALFGASSEDAEKIIQKVSGAMAVLQGVQAVSNALSKEGSLMLTIQNALRARQVQATTAAAGAEVTAAAATAGVTAATGAATVATNAFTAALLANPVTAIIVALLAAAAALYYFVSNTDDAKEATDALNASLERQNTLLEMDEAALKRRGDIAVAYAKAQGQSEATIRDIEAGNLKERLKLRENFTKGLAAEYDKALAEGLISEEDFKKLGNDLTKAQNDEADARAQVQIKEYNDRAAANKEQEALLKKRNADAKKAAEEYRKVTAQLNKYIKETAALEIEAMADGFAKERAQAQSQAKVRIDQLNTDVSLSKKAAEQKKLLIAAINKNLAAELLKIDQEETKKKAALQMEANSMLADARQEGLKKELALLGAEYDNKVAQITETFKNEEKLRGELLESLFNSTARKRAELIAADKLKQLNLEEESEVLGVQLMAEFAGKSSEVEELKQIEILKVQLKYAELRLNSIVDDGTKETAVKKKQAALEVKEITDAISTSMSAQKSKGFDWFKAFGMGELSDEQKQKVIDGAQKGLEAVGEITNFIVDQYQRQIDKKQEVIDQYDKDLDDLEERLDKEKELRENGFANNVEILEAEIAEKQKAKEEELKQQEELQKKQQAIQKLQLLADTGVQASNMITAATSIFKSFAVIPFGLGIPLAIGVIAAMTGAFVVSKVKALQAINDGAKMAKGGLVDGPSHAAGGKKYVAQDGTGRVVELEGGEMVINKRDTAKHIDVLTAINEGRLHELSDQALANFLAGTGVVMNNDAPKKAIHEVRERDESRIHFIKMGGNSQSGELVSISEDVRFLATKSKNEVIRWEDENYYYEKRGNTVTKTRKK